MKLLPSFLKKKSTELMTGGNQSPNFWPSANSLQSLYQRVVNPTKANISVTSESAFQLAAYWLAVRAISEDIAKLPINLFTVDSKGKKKPIAKSPLQQILTQGFNSETDSMTGRQTMIQWMLTYGNAYAEVLTNDMGEMSWILIHPERVNVQRNGNGNLIYVVTQSSELDNRQRVKQNTNTLQANQMLHLKGPGNGVVGYSIGQIAAQSLGISIAAQDFTGAFFGNNLALGAALETDKALNAEQKKAIRDDWKKKFGGSSKAGEMAILDRSFKFSRIQMNSTDAELLNTRKFQIEEIARWFRIPPHKLMDMSKSTFNNVEQQDINYATDTLTPWISRIETQLKFRFHRKDNTVIDIDEKALSRGDMKARSGFLKEMFAMGAMSGNQIALAEGLPEYTGGETRFIPMNLTPLEESLKSASLDNDVKEKSLEEPEPVQEPEPVEPVIEPKEEDPEPTPVQAVGVSEQAAIAAYLPSMADSLSRLTRKEQLNHESAAKKEPQQMKESLDKFYCKFETELKDCLQLHANYLCNILDKELFTSDKLMFISKEICQLDKQDNQADRIVEMLLSDIDEALEAPKLGEIRQDEDGAAYSFTMNGWVEVDTVKK